MLKTSSCLRLVAGTDIFTAYDHLIPFPQCLNAEQSGGAGASSSLTVGAAISFSSVYDVGRMLVEEPVAAMAESK